MARQKRSTNEQKLTKALQKLPWPLEDKKHNLSISLPDERARSNQSRFQHIIQERHELDPNDIKRIPRYIKKCIFKKDKERTETFNIYIRRNSYSDEYIKISVRIEPSEPKKAYIKTIYITKIIK